MGSKPDVRNHTDELFRITLLGYLCLWKLLPLCDALDARWPVADHSVDGLDIHVRTAKGFTVSRKARARAESILQKRNLAGRFRDISYEIRTTCSALTLVRNATADVCLQ